MARPNLPQRLLGLHIFGSLEARTCVDVFVDLQCPFSRKAWRTLRALPEELKPLLCVNAYIYIQPWHGLAHVMSKAAFAVVDFDVDGGLRFIDQVYENQEKFKDEDSKSPNDVYDVLVPFAEAQGMNRDAFMGEVTAGIGHSGNVTRQIKFHTKYGRQNAIHSTPTFMVNGIVYNAASSSWTAQEWDAFARSMLL